ncbi:MerR family transcriptional regulator [Paenibacillus macerans]|uniref:MerR family transcriptional regulator n=1 Tax=Paenibacillus macerans TaxID=44252 RepID=UPI00203E5815|nr:MerR family transcriptional regulator [Paenibacillus macerans]MCM3702668.1 MerR family transcriptional regulator [Paenibacillus macerans]
MKIGELSKATGVSIRSLRYYEEQGLITSERLNNGYRDYHSLTAEQVKTIQFYLSLGLTTQQIAGFLQCVMTSQEAFCREIMPVYRSKLKEITEQIELLQTIKSNLEERIHYILEENPEMEMMEYDDQTDRRC